jgi:hypothetical protein
MEVYFFNVSNNNPTLEYFLNKLKQFSADGITRIIESRVAFEDILK